MKTTPLTFFLFLSSIFLQASTPLSQKPDQLLGHRFLTFNTVIRVNQIEVARDKNVGHDERSLHTPDKVIKFRSAIERGISGSHHNMGF